MDIFISNHKWLNFSISVVQMDSRPKHIVTYRKLIDLILRFFLRKCNTMFEKNKMVKLLANFFETINVIANQTALIQLFSYINITVVFMSPN